MVEGDSTADLHLRALRIVETRVRSSNGRLSAAETRRLLALELAETNSLELVEALAAVGAAMTVMVEEAVGVLPDVLFARMRSMLTEAR